MNVCQTSYALGQLSAALLSLASAKRALQRRGLISDEEQVEVLAGMITQAELLIHGLGSDLIFGGLPESS
jgi:hypothetical protein